MQDPFYHKQKRVKDNGNRMLNADAWLDTFLYQLWQSIGAGYTRFHDFMARFHVSGIKRVVVELVSDAFTFGAIGLVLLTALALPAFDATTSGQFNKVEDYSVTFLDKFGNEIGRRGIGFGLPDAREHRGSGFEQPIRAEVEHTDTAEESIFERVDRVCREQEDGIGRRRRRVQLRKKRELGGPGHLIGFVTDYDVPVTAERAVMTAHGDVLDGSQIALFGGYVIELPAELLRDREGHGGFSESAGTE